MTPITIENDGQAIQSTNYWNTERGQCGLLFLSWHAGAARLLVPFGIVSELRANILHANNVIISRGAWTDEAGRDALELLFEGDSAAFCCSIVIEQTDGPPTEFAQGGGFVFTVWTSDGEIMRLPGKYREVPTLPCQESWQEH